LSLYGEYLIFVLLVVPYKWHLRLLINLEQSSPSEEGKGEKGLHCFDPIFSLMLKNLSQKEKTKGRPAINLNR
jgi:hypothetical protein